MVRNPPGGQPAKHATIYDVAAAAGVSASTVSRAFSRPGRVSSSTAQRVRAVAEELGYRGHSIYRPESGTRTGAIGLALSDVTNPFYFPIIRGAERAVAKADHTLVLADAQESESVEREMLTRILPLIDALVIASSRISDTHLRSLARTRPVLVLNRSVHGLPSVLPDTHAGVRQVLEHLIGLGHERLLYVSGPDASYANGVRWRSLREQARAAGLDVTQLGSHPPTVQGGTAAAQRFTGRETAVVAYNDLMAMGFIKGLRTRGIDVPGHVSVTGFDNIFAADLVTPALTTVSAPMSTMGDLAVSNVIALTRGARPTVHEPTVVPTQLVVRESSGPAPRPR